MNRGRITREFTAWCGKCLGWEQEGQENRISEATKRFKKRGWRVTRDHGWMCPTCVRQRRNERDQRSRDRARKERAP